MDGDGQTDKVNISRWTVIHQCFFKAQSDAQSVLFLTLRPCTNVYKLSSTAETMSAVDVRYRWSTRYTAVRAILTLLSFRQIFVVDTSPFNF